MNAPLRTLRTLRNLLSGKCASSRRYLRRGISVDLFFQNLSRAGVTYAVLRWFDDLPQVDLGEDIDVLVADEDLARIGRFLRCSPPSGGGQPVDIYTAGGLAGSDFAGIPYYPERLARRILERAVLHRGLVRVPCPEDHFLSLAHHVIYHKGIRSGLPVSGEPHVGANAEHDYAGVLKGLAKTVGYDGPITLESLDAFLATHGWRPSRDALERLSRKNPWIKSWFSSEWQNGGLEWVGLCVLLIRRRALELGIQQAVAGELEREGFEILDVWTLSQLESERAAPQIRGGNWGRGPWPTSGGPPAEVIVAFDPRPWAVGSRERTIAPELDNARIVRAKTAIRKKVQRDLPPSGRCNVLHFSDNATQALSYLDILAPEKRGRLLAELTAIRRAVESPYPVLGVMNRWERRASVYLIRHGNGRAVCKIFRPGARRYFERELHALKTLGPIRPEIPELIEEGDGWFITPEYNGCLDRHRGVLPLQMIWQILDFARCIHDHGLFLLDLHPGNVFADPKRGIKIVDYEFLQAYEGKRPSFEQSYMLSGVPRDFRGDMPVDQASNIFGAMPIFKTGTTGLSRRSLLRSPPWLQRAERAALIPALSLLRIGGE